MNFTLALGPFVDWWVHQGYSVVAWEINSLLINHIVSSPFFCSLSLSFTLKHTQTVCTQSLLLFDATVTSNSERVHFNQWKITVQLLWVCDYRGQMPMCLNRITHMYTNSWIYTDNHISYHISVHVLGEGCGEGMWPPRCQHSALDPSPEHCAEIQPQ